MKEQINVKNIINKGSARKKAELLITHYNILEAINNGNKTLKPILNEKEVNELFEGFKTQREINVYNNYRQLNIDVIQYIRELQIKALNFEKYLYQFYILIKEARKKTEFYEYIEKQVIIEYEEFINYYEALKLFTQKAKYNDEITIKVIDDTFLIPILHFQTNYLSKKSEIEIVEKLKEIKKIRSTEAKIKQIISNEFNYFDEK